MSKSEARKRHHMKTMSKEWTAWSEIPVTPALIAQNPQLKNCQKIYANSRYEVQLYNCSAPGIGGVVQMVVARHGHLEEITWNELQRIKTELFGVAFMALEIYPRELVTKLLKVRFLWIMPEDYDIPIGLDKPGAWGER